MPETQSAAEKPAEQSSESAMAFTPRQWTIAVSSCSARDHGKSGPKKNRGQIDLGVNCAGKQDLARYHNALEHASARPQRAVLTTILRDPRGPEFGDRDPFRGPRRSCRGAEQPLQASAARIACSGLRGIVTREHAVDESAEPLACRRIDDRVLARLTEDGHGLPRRLTDRRRRPAADGVKDGMWCPRRTSRTAVDRVRRGSDPSGGEELEGFTGLEREAVGRDDRSNGHVGAARADVQARRGARTRNRQRRLVGDVEAILRGRQSRKQA